jgi:hypothetical protein
LEFVADGEAERLRGLEINGELKLGRLLDGIRNANQVTLGACTFPQGERDTLTTGSGAACLVPDFQTLMVRRASPPNIVGPGLNNLVRLDRDTAA